MEKQVVLITGASSGLGSCLAKAFATRGHQVHLWGRSTEDLTKLINELNSSDPNVASFSAFDLNDQTCFQKAVMELSAPQVLVLNAAQNYFGRVLDFSSMQAQTELMRVNIEVNLRLLERYSDSIRSGATRVIMIGSGASFFPAGYECLYHASKAFLLYLAEGLWAEGVDVQFVVLCQFRSKLAKRSGIPFEGPSWIRSDPMDIAQKIVNDHLRKSAWTAFGIQAKLILFFYLVNPLRVMSAIQSMIFKNLWLKKKIE